jgi:hypothetical protein
MGENVNDIDEPIPSCLQSNAIRGVDTNAPIGLITFKTVGMTAPSAAFVDILIDKDRAGTPTLGMLHTDATKIVTEVPGRMSTDVSNVSWNVEFVHVKLRRNFEVFVKAKAVPEF